MSTVISVNPAVLGGMPVFAGTRVPIESLFDYLEQGCSVDYFLEQFPTVQRSQVVQLLESAKAIAIADCASI